MAVFLNNKVGVKINTVDLSDHVTSITLNRTFDELEVTAMGDTAHKFVKGLEASSVTIDFLNDTASANVLATLQAAWGTTVTCVFLQDKGTAVSATNPLYTVSLEGEITPAVEYSFEQYAKKGFHKAFRDEEKQSDVYWLAWEVTRRSGETVKPFGMDFIETLKSVEVLDSDPLA